MNSVNGHHVRIQRGAGCPDPLENNKNIGFLSNTGPDPLKITKLPIQHSMLGHYGPLAKRHLDKKRKKNVVKVGPLTKLSGSAHEHIGPVHVI